MNITVAVFFIGFNVYFAYIGNYIIYYLGYTADQMGIIEAVPLVLSMLTAIPASKLINNNKHVEVSIFAIIINIIGLLVIWPVTPDMVDNTKLFDLRLWLGIFLVGVGYVTILQTTKVWTKQLYPKDSKSQFEGIWILFFVLIPMVGGSFIGEAVVKTSGEVFQNSTSGQMEYIPNGNIYLYGALIIVLTLIPLFVARKYNKKRVAEESNSEV